MYSLLRKVNIVLTVVIVSLGLYLVLAPIIPRTGIIAYAKEWIKDDVLNLKRNKIVISSIGVNAEILEGDKSVLNKGFWRIPDTSTPDEGGNTVIVGHRYIATYGPNTFINLDKVQLGDKIEIIWDNHTYSYQVKEVKKVPSTDLDIEKPTDESILTLYTCTSLWDNSERLVVVSEMIEN